MATCWRPSTLKGRGAQEEAAEARPRVKMAADRGVRRVKTGIRDYAPCWWVVAITTRRG